MCVCVFLAPSAWDIAETKLSALRDSADSNLVLYFKITVQYYFCYNMYYLLLPMQRKSLRLTEIRVAVAVGEDAKQQQLLYGGHRALLI